MTLPKTKIQTWLIALCTSCICLSAYAATNLNISNEVDADFGDIEYSAFATGNIAMGTNGIITYPAGFTGAGIGVAGQFRSVITGFGTGLPYVISCTDSAAKLSNGAGGIIPIRAEYVVSAANRGNFGTGNDCAGLTNISIGYTGTPRTYYVGVRMNISTPLTTGGVYSTANAGGAPIEFLVVLQ